MICKFYESTEVDHNARQNLSQNVNRNVFFYTRNAMIFLNIILSLFIYDISTSFIRFNCNFSCIYMCIITIYMN